MLSNYKLLFPYLYHIRSWHSPTYIQLEAVISQLEVVNLYFYTITVEAVITSTDIQLEAVFPVLISQLEAVIRLLISQLEAAIPLLLSL